MIASLNEIEGVLRKAALGADWPMGLAEEAGRAAAWLAARGLDGVGTALAALGPGPAPLPSPPDRPAPGDDDWVFPAARAAMAGPSAFDLLAGGAAATRVRFADCDEPLLLVGLAGVAAAAYGGGYDLAFAGGGRAEVSADAVTLTGPPPAAGAEVLATRAARHPPEAPAGDGAVEAAAGVAVDDGVWGRALAMAARSYVPSSAASREHGAGAGLIETD